MKDSTRQGGSLQTKKDEKEAVTDEDEEKFRSAGLFSSGTAKQLLDTIYFYNGEKSFFFKYFVISFDFYLNYLFNVVIFFLIQYCKAP